MSTDLKIRNLIAVVLLSSFCSSAIAATEKIVKENNDLNGP